MAGGLHDSAVTAQVILFADIVGSTALYEALGDARAHARVTAGLECMKAVARARHGRVVAELGDEVMCFFEDPAQGAAAACEMHARFRAEFPAAGDLPALQLRIGMHYAPTSGRAEDFAAGQGKVAHWAARNAKPEQTLVTQAVFDALPRLLRASSRHVDDETLELVEDEQLALYEIFWDIDAITVNADRVGAADGQRYVEVHFWSGIQEVVLDADRSTITVGRDPRCDIVLAHDLVSREHFTAHFSRGRCTLTDRSTNGTFVTPDHGTRVDVRRDSLALAGSGKIVLGSSRPQGDLPTIRYVCG